MTIQIPAFLQNKAYGARLDRQVFGDRVQRGVVGTADLQAIPSGTTRGIQIRDGSAYIQGQITPPLQGYYRFLSDAYEARTHDAAVTYPRIDQVIARVQDSTENGNVGPDVGTLEIVKGVEASGATLDNRLGATTEGSIPKNFIRLADVLITPGMGVIPNGNIRDRRGWALGVFGRGDWSGGTSTVNITAGSFVTPPGLGPLRLELSGATIRVQLQAIFTAVTGPLSLALAAFINGAELDQATKTYAAVHSGKAVTIPASPEIFGITPGSTLIDPKVYADTSGTGNPNMTGPVRFTVREIMPSNYVAQS